MIIPATWTAAVNRPQSQAELDALNRVVQGDACQAVTDAALSDIERFADHLGLLKNGKLLLDTDVVDQLFDALGAVEVERGTADRGAMRALEAVLERGEPVAIFPEGTRRAGPEITELFAGAAFLSVKFGVPIVPVGIGGSEHILPKGKIFPRIHRVAVSVGEPLVPPALDGRARRGAAAALTAQLHAELQRCFDDADRLAR